jgi:hypothetical protein
MFVRRLTADLKEQKWTTIGIELIIVIIGVFVGTLVANSNQERVERHETQQMLRDLKPELIRDIQGFAALREYYQVTRHYGDIAFAGWAGDPRVTDRDFVIAAYQASQTTFTGLNNSSWAQIFGSDRLREVDDAGIREDLGALMTTDYNVLEKEIFSNYREHVRQVIPEDVQDAIRAQCGDQSFGNFGALGYTRLPATCSLNIPDERFRIAAQALRSHPELVGEMRWHFAAVATYIGNINILEVISRRLLKRIESV